MSSWAEEQTKSLGAECVWAYKFDKIVKALRKTKAEGFREGAAAFAFSSKDTMETLEFVKERAELIERGEE